LERARPLVEFRRRVFAKSLNEIEVVLRRDNVGDSEITIDGEHQIGICEWVTGFIVGCFVLLAFLIMPELHEYDQIAVERRQ